KAGGGMWGPKERGVKVARWKSTEGNHAPKVAVVVAVVVVVAAVAVAGSNPPNFKLAIKLA
ncbi:MAG: hypothetical protein J7J98_00935, partial [candidate division Zixibacteria bacterium]|nr:hypothetical protein [candidate division Zixibacteria bacterium]